MPRRASLKGKFVGNVFFYLFRFFFLVFPRERYNFNSVICSEFLTKCSVCLWRYGNLQCAGFKCNTTTSSSLEGYRKKKTKLNLINKTCHECHFIESVKLCAFYGREKKDSKMIKRTKLGEPYRVSYISNDGRCEAGAIFALIRTNESFYCR